MEPKPLYKYIDNLAEQLPAIPENSIISQTLYIDEQVKAVLFTFAAGQELSEHTASTSATIHILAGEGRLILGKDEHVARPGTWVHMTPNLPHSIFAKTPLSMLLLLLK